MLLHFVHSYVSRVFCVKNLICNLFDNELINA